MVAYLQEPGILININYPIPKNYTQPGPVSKIYFSVYLIDLTLSYQAVWPQ